jgi:hypothetical protein
MDSEQSLVDRIYQRMVEYLSDKPNQNVISAQIREGKCRAIIALIVEQARAKDNYSEDYLFGVCQRIFNLLYEISS